MVTTYKAADGYEPKLLVQFARDHLAAADFLYEAGFPYLDSAGYLAHLSLEPLLKAYLLRFSGEFPGSHKLLDLYDQVGDCEPVFKIEPPYLESLRAFDQQYRLRYPHPTATPSVAQGDRSVLHHLVNLIAGQLPDDLREVTDSSQLTEKGHRSIIRAKGDL